MSIGRIANLTQSSYMSSQIMKDEATVSDLSSQTASGQKSTTYSGYGDQTSAMESARAVVNRNKAYQTGTTLATTQAKLQDDQLSQLSDLASQLKTALGSAVSSGDASSLSTTCKGIFDQASAILNYKDSNGSYVYGGGNDTAQPFAVSSFADLATADLTTSFVNGTSTKSVQVADSQTVAYGLTASAIGTDLMTALKNVSSYISTNGDFSSTLTEDQSTFLSDQIVSATTAYKSVNATAAANGNIYKELETASDTQSSMVSLYSGFVSDVQDADMSTVATDLSNAQTALQAVVMVTSSLNKISLLNYLS